MHRETVETWVCGPYTLELSYSLDNETPNSVYGIWERVDRHQGGVTVALPAQYSREGVTHWRSCNYTPAELTKDYAKQGRENPAKAAYESLQQELIGEVTGDMVTVWLHVYVAGRECAYDCVGTAHYPDGDIDNTCQEMLGDYFNVFALCAQAQDEIVNMAAQVA